MKQRVLLVLCAMMLAGCNESHEFKANVKNISSSEAFGSGIFTTHRQGLTKANKCEDYRAYLLDSAAAEITNNYFNSYWWNEVEEVAAEPSAPSDAVDGSPKDDSAGEFTTTNIQEAGVDEPDIVKNDDKWMYVLQGDSVKILKAWPAQEMTQVADIQLEGGYGQGMFLQDGKLILFSNVYRYGYDRPFGGTHIAVYDVSDPAEPRLLHTHDIEGNYVNARMIDGKIYVVLNSWVSAYSWENYDQIIKDLPEYDWDEIYRMDDEQRQKLIEQYTPVVRARLEKLSPSISAMHFPRYSDGNNIKDAVSCDNIYMPKMAGRENGMLIVAELSGDAFDRYSARAVTDGGWTVYASTSNIYLVSSSYNWYWYCWDGDSCRNYSQIHRFDLKNGLHYAGTGEIEGYVSDSYWMSEYDGHLRVASDHLSGWWNSSEGSSLSVLDISSMQKVGGVDGIAKGEQIYAARMFGPKGYMVTFENTDPLFTLDLSDPKNPTIKGELKIYGYSSYIHPLGDDALLTIGRDGDENGTIKGVQLQIFDVSDLTDPQRIAHEVITQEDYNNYSDSAALWDTHAFMYHAGSGMLSVPINIYHWSYNDNYNFSGAVVYRATRDNGFERIGIVNHADLLPPNDDENDYYYRWWTQLDRSRFYFANQGVYDRDAYIYTISDVGVKVSDALHPATTYQTVKY